MRNPESAAEEKKTQVIPMMQTMCYTRSSQSSLKFFNLCVHTKVLSMMDKLAWTNHCTRSINPYSIPVNPASSPKKQIGLLWDLQYGTFNIMKFYYNHSSVYGMQQQQYVPCKSRNSPITYSEIDDGQHFFFLRSSGKKIMWKTLHCLQFLLIISYTILSHSFTMLTALVLQSFF